MKHLFSKKSFFMWGILEDVLKFENLSNWNLTKQIVIWPCSWTTIIRIKTILYFYRAEPSGFRIWVHRYYQNNHHFFRNRQMDFSKFKFLSVCCKRKRKKEIQILGSAIIQRAYPPLFVDLIHPWTFTNRLSNWWSVWPWNWFPGRYTRNSDPRDQSEIWNVCSFWTLCICPQENSKVTIPKRDTFFLLVNSQGGAILILIG